MSLWRMLWKAEALLLALMVGCATVPSSVRLESGADGTTHLFIPRTETVEFVEVTPEETTRAIQRLAMEVHRIGPPRETVEHLFQVDALYGDYFYLEREHKLVPLDSGTPLDRGVPDEVAACSR